VVAAVAARATQETQSRQKLCHAPYAIMCHICAPQTTKHKMLGAGAGWGEARGPGAGAVGRIWWPEATRLEDPLDISNGT
jgi:hypothetical protein